MAAVETPPDQHRVPRQIIDGFHQRNSPASHPGRTDRPFQLWSGLRWGGGTHCPRLSQGLRHGSTPPSAHPSSPSPGHGYGTPGYSLSISCTLNSTFEWPPGKLSPELDDDLLEDPGAPSHCSAMTPAAEGSVPFTRSCR